MAWHVRHYFADYPYVEGGIRGGTTQGLRLPDPIQQEGSWGQTRKMKYFGQERRPEFFILRV